MAAVFQPDGKFITYEEFGAVGDGKHDDQNAIIAAHDAANKMGLPVKATDGKTYYIGKGKKPAIIKTDTDWGKARRNSMSISRKEASSGWRTRTRRYTSAKD